jgi:hypothetical protein
MKETRSKQKRANNWTIKAKAGKIVTLAEPNQGS